jgi:hypothetical protein
MTWTELGSNALARADLAAAAFAASARLHAQLQTHADQALALMNQAAVVFLQWFCVSED